MNHILESTRAAQIQTILGEWDIPPVRSIDAVNEGDSVFKVSTVDQIFTLKDISGAPDRQQLDFTRDVLTHVARSGLRVPVPLAARSGEYAVSFEGRTYLLYEFIQATEYPSELEVQPELFYQAGHAIARLHEALATFPDMQVGSRTWRQDLAGAVPGWFAALTAGLPDEQAAVVKQVRMDRGDSIERALQGLPEQLIHRDCHPGNILVEGTRVTGFIDCDHLSIGPRVFDLAYYAVHHVKWVTDDAAATAEVAALPHAMMAYHLLLADWVLGQGMREPIALEVRALDWLNSHLKAIVDATQ